MMKQYQTKRRKDEKIFQTTGLPVYTGTVFYSDAFFA
jgi:hypothetical protein